MCHPKPGPRCSHHTKKAVKRAQIAYTADSSVENFERLSRATEEWYSTPSGQHQLANKIATLPDGAHRDELQVKLERGIRDRESALYLLKKDQEKRAVGEGVSHMIYPDGREEWSRDGKLHREDGPALIKADGTKEWYKDGQRYNGAGPNA